MTVTVPPYRAVVTGHSFPTLAPEREVLAGVATVVESQPRDRAEVIAAARDADAIMNQQSLIDAAVIAALTRCRVIVAYGIGTDKIDLAAAAARGIRVCHVPDYCVDEVASHAMALLLAFERRVPQAMARLVHGHWDHPTAGSIRRLAGRTLGLLGLGRIGRRVAALAAPFGLRVVAHDPYLAAAPTGQPGVEWVSFDELLTTAHYLSIHCPLTPETRGLMGAAQFARMRADAVLVNASRGKIVQEAALVAALREGRLRGAALDVFEEEPLSPGNSLLDLDNVVLTPHVAWYSDEAQDELKREVAGEVRRALLGEPPRHPVNAPAPATSRQPTGR